MELNNIIISILILFSGYLLNKYFLIISYKYKFNILTDDQFNKPQAFHENSTPRAGGVTTFLLLSFIFLYLYLYENIFYLEYISFCALFFLLGLLDDCKINLKPKFRLLIMLVSLVALVLFNKFYIEKTGLEFLNHLLEIDIFSLFFICLCFLFIINGSNLIDGFNGLLSIHTLIVLLVLLAINFSSKNYDLFYVLFYICIAILIFLKFNFPKAKMFLGDSGAYLLGSVIAVSTVKTSISNPEISPFFFCILLFYLFFEVFFSFFRKLIFVKKSPLFPDSQHLHMLVYKLLLKNKPKLSSNYTTTMYINLSYLLLLIPGILFMKNGEFCRYYFFLLSFIYIGFYRIMFKAVK